MTCKLCLVSFDQGEFVVLTEKGAKHVNNVSALRNAGVQVIPGDKVHTKCR